MKYLLLKAVKHNWGLMGPGDWKEERWTVYSDGLYTRVLTYNPTLEEVEEMRTNDDCIRTTAKCVKRTRGRIKHFDRLQKLITSDPWIDPQIVCNACDGVAWKIDVFSPEGEIIKTSGDRIGYIYGQRVLEEIAALLPSGKLDTQASAFISVKRKTQKE